MHLLVSRGENRSLANILNKYFWNDESRLLKSDSYFKDLVQLRRIIIENINYFLILLKFGYNSCLYVYEIGYKFKSSNTIISHSSQRKSIRNAYLTSSISHDTNYLRVLKRSTAQFISPLKLFCMQYGNLTHIRT